MRTAPMGGRRRKLLSVWKDDTGIKALELRFSAKVKGEASRAGALVCYRMRQDEGGTYFRAGEHREGKGERWWQTNNSIYSYYNKTTQTN